MFDSFSRGTLYEPLPESPQQRGVSPETEEASLPEQVLNRSGEWMGNHPLWCVSLGVAIGAALGWLIKRK